MVPFSGPDCSYVKHNRTLSMEWPSYRGILEIEPLGDWGAFSIFLSLTVWHILNNTYEVGLSLWYGILFQSTKHYRMLGDFQENLVIIIPKEPGLLSIIYCPYLLFPTLTSCKSNRVGLEDLPVVSNKNKMICWWHTAFVLIPPELHTVLPLLVKRQWQGRV